MGIFMKKRRKLSNIGIVCFSTLVLVIVALLVVFIAISINDAEKNKQNPSIPDSSDSSSQKEPEKEDTEKEPEYVTRGEFVLDADFSCLLLVNAQNPLPEDYDANVRQYLKEIDDEYRNNDYVTQIHEDVYPYITAMVANALKDGVNLQVWSPFRSYAIQQDLFRKQVERVGGDEEKAATVVARPGTSEHNTGFCADFNMASDAFEDTEMFAWMKENAEDYGFIMRYSAEKQDITGVIHESWHWRFVGIKTAKEINSLGMCLEEYIDYISEE